ncbi:hypothetical protein V1477_012056 [Vespula maculifrons]|uniref:Uncharacterized protein n=1 Tax=Vespula maculifrons TaxID=7453 RepID=A0ABD2C0Y3_VESMC
MGIGIAISSVIVNNTSWPVFLEISMEGYVESLLPLGSIMNMKMRKERKGKEPGRCDGSNNEGWNLEESSIGLKSAGKQRFLHFTEPKEDSSLLRAYCFFKSA